MMLIVVSACPCLSLFIGPARVSLFIFTFFTFSLAFVDCSCRLRYRRSGSACVCILLHSGCRSGSVCARGCRSGSVCVRSGSVCVRGLLCIRTIRDFARLGHPHCIRTAAQPSPVG